MDIKFNIHVFNVVFSLLFSFQDGYSQEDTLSKTLISKRCDSEFHIPLYDSNYSNQSSWLLVFEENFEGDSLDFQKWRNMPHEGSFGGYSWSSYQSMDNVELKDGIAHLYVKEERVYRKATSWKDSTEILQDGIMNARWYNYTAASIRTFQAYRYGKFEARLKIPSHKGVLPAMWLYGSLGENNNLPGTISNEIDVFEFWQGSLNGINTNVHVGFEGCGVEIEKDDYSADFHVFKMIWEPDRIEWYVDDELIRSYHRFFQLGKEVNGRLYAFQTYEEAFFPVFPMLIIFSVWMHQSFVDQKPEDCIFPADFQIDWIKYYQREDLMNIQDKAAIDYRIYPNPSTNQINIRVYPVDLKFDLTIYDHLGRPVYYYPQAENEHLVITSQLHAGIYYAKAYFAQGGGYINKVFLIQ